MTNSENPNENSQNSEPSPIDQQLDALMAQMPNEQNSSWRSRIEKLTATWNDLLTSGVNALQADDVNVIAELHTETGNLLKRVDAQFNLAEDLQLKGELEQMRNDLVALQTSQRQVAQPLCEKLGVELPAELATQTQATANTEGQTTNQDAGTAQPTAAKVAETQPIAEVKGKPLPGLKTVAWKIGNMTSQWKRHSEQYPQAQKTEAALLRGYFDDTLELDAMLNTHRNILATQLATEERAYQNAAAEEKERAACAMKACKEDQKLSENLQQETGRLLRGYHERMEVLHKLFGLQRLPNSPFEKPAAAASMPEESVVTPLGSPAPAKPTPTPTVPPPPAPAAGKPLSTGGALGAVALATASAALIGWAGWTYGAPLAATAVNSFAKPALSTKLGMATYGVVGVGTAIACYKLLTKFGSLLWSGIKTAWGMVTGRRRAPATMETAS